MTVIQFDDLRLVEFILASTSGMVERAGESELSVRDDVDRALIQRFRDGQTTLLRYSLSDECDLWMITGFDEAEIIRTASRLRHFLTPTYGFFTHNIEDVQRFNSVSPKIKPLALGLGLPGFFRLKISARYHSNVLHALRTWMKLEADRPIVERVDKPTYRDLFTAFQRSLATSSWDDARESLEHISRYRLTTADNITFLEIRLFSAQERWRDIWESARYPEWAKQRIPRQIRTALITAYHHSVLLPLEMDDNWQEGLRAFRQTRHRLGRLLETRLQESSLPVIRVFAYLAVDTEDHNLVGGLRSTLAPDVLAGISPILDLIPPQKPAPPPTLLQELEVARLLYIEADLDSARKMIDELENPAIRASLRVDLAVRTRDRLDAEEALNATDDLQAWERNDLLEAKPYLQRHISDLRSLIGLTDMPSEPVDSWVVWLKRAEASAPDTELESTLDLLLEQSDERMWEPAEARTISNAVQSIVLNTLLTARTVIRQGISTLADHLLLDEQFPRPGHTYVELYEAMYTFILETGQRSEPESKRLLCYAEAILMNDPERVVGVSTQLQDWFPSPLPILLDTRLDALELVCDYGLDGRALVHHVRMWADTMLSFPSDIDESTLRAWAEFAEMIDAGNDIVTRLREHKAIAEGSFGNVVARLHERFKIAIFTLRPKSADRVRAMLLDMNPNLDVQISGEKDLSPRVKQLAASANLPVVVATCITHALTYGIGPYLKVEPVRPESSGSTSIMRAIEGAVGGM